MESAKVLTAAPAKVPNIGEKIVKGTAEAIMTQVRTQAGPSVPTETGPTEIVEARPSDATKISKESESPTAGVSTEGLEFVVRHAARKNYQKSRLPKLCIMLRI
jgi:hypothetical protein